MTKSCILKLKPGDKITFKGSDYIYDFIRLDFDSIPSKIYFATEGYIKGVLGFISWGHLSRVGKIIKKLK